MDSLGVVGGEIMIQVDVCLLFACIWLWETLSILVFVFEFFVELSTCASFFSFMESVSNYSDLPNSKYRARL